MPKYEVVSTYVDRDGNTVLPGDFVEVNEVYGARLLSAKVAKLVEAAPKPTAPAKKPKAVKQDADDTQEG
jgi:hypothetical protein